MRIYKSILRIALLFIVLLGQLPLLAAPAQAAQGLDMYFKTESGSSSQMTTSPFKTGTCFTSRGDINQNWGANSPGGSCPIDGFTMYAEGFIKAPATGTVTFYSATDDGFLLNINNQTVISDLTDHGLGQPYNGTGSIQMTAGTYYPIKVWFHENFGSAALFLQWTYPGVTQQTQITPDFFDTEAPPVDQQNPVVVVGSGVLSSPTVEAGQSFSITYRVTDDVACCNQHDVLFYNSQNQNLVAFSAPSAQISGTPTNVTFRANVSVGSSIAPGTYIARTQTTDLAGKFTFLQEIGSIQVTAATPTSPTPTLATATSTAGGFTTQVTNYDPGFNWTVSTTSGTATINGTGLVSVTGLQPLATATVTVTSSKTGFTNGQASRSGSALDGDPEAVTPQFATAPSVPGSSNTTFGTSVLDGCDAQIINYNGKLAWSGSSTTPNATLTISNTGRIQVRGMGSQNTGRITIQSAGANNTTRQATFDCVSWYPIIGIQSTTTSTFVLKTNYLAGITYDLVASSGTVTNSLNGTITISNLQASTDVSLTVKTYSGSTLIWPQSGQGSGIFPLGKTLAGQTQSPLNFTLPTLTVGTTAQLAASGGSGSGAFSFVSNSQSICTISGTTLTPITSGTCSITATKAGDATFAEAKSTQSATVAQAGVPTLSITSPTNNQTLAGSFTLAANAAIAPGSTARLTVACLFLDGVANNSGAVNNGLGSWSSGYNNRGPAGNCYDIRSLTSTPIRWDLDATTWSNGDHQLAVRVYDSANKESALVSVPVKVTIGVPTLSITSPTNNQTLAGSFTLAANAAIAPGSTARLTVACLFLDGVANNSGAVNNGLGSWSSGYNNRGPAGNCYDIRSLTSTPIRWDLDATTWSNGDHQLAVRVYDSANKESALVSVPVKVTIGVPTLSITSPTNNQTLAGSFTLAANAAIAPGSTARLTVACLFLDGVANNSGAVNNGLGSWSSGYNNRGPAGNCYDIRSLTSTPIRWDLDATTWSNGDHQLAVRVYDSANKESALVSVPVKVTIGVPTLSITSPTNNQTLAGSFTLAANAAIAPGSTARLTVACLFLDGVANNSGAVNNGLGSWSSGYNNRGPAGNCYDIRSLTSTPIRWDLDATTWSNGDHQLAVRVYDSANKESALVSVPVKVTNAAPEVTSLLPKSGAMVYGNFNVEVRWTSTSGVSHVGLSLPCTSQTSGAYSQNPSIKNPPTGMTYFNVTGARSQVFICAVDTNSLLNNQNKTSRDVKVLLIDRAGQTAEETTQLLILSPKPSLEIRSPLANQSVRGEIQIELWAKSPIETGRKINYVGISESKARATTGSSASFYGSRMPSKFTPYSINSNQSGEWLNFVWNLDLAEFEPGLRTVEVAVQDTNGDIVEQSVQFLVQNPELQLDFLTPRANQVIEGDVEIKVLANPDVLTKHKIKVIAIDLKGVEPTFVGAQMSEWQSKVPRNFRAWEIEARSLQNQFSWRAEAGSIPNGTYAVTVIAFDDKGFSKKSTTQIVIATPNPEVRISKPNAGVVGSDSLELTMNAQIPKSVNAKVDLVGINVAGAVPAFLAQQVRLNNSNQLRDFTFWRVDNASDFTWTLNPANWPDGDRSITVMVLDSNNKIGQTSVLLHKAPAARWNIVVKDPPVLGKSVAIGVTMTTSSERRPEPSVTARLQTSSAPRGPWTDAGTLTFDKAGVAAGRVIVTSPMYVRVYHDTLDAVLPGASESLRIVNVPDPSRNLQNKSSGDSNEDGSIPTVTCTPPQKAALKKRLTVSCTAVDVQNPAQPLNTYVQQGKSFRKVGSAQLDGNLIRFNVTIKKVGNYIFEVRGEGSSSRFTQWRSNRVSINVKK